MQFHNRPWPVLSPSEMEMIHQKTVELLESPGLYVDHDGFLDVLEAHGATVDRSTRVAKIPARTTDEAARAISNSPCLMKDDHQSVERELSARMERALSAPLSFRFGGSGLEVLNEDLRSSRPAVYDDVERVIRFGNGHPRISTIGGPPVQYAYEPDGSTVPPVLRPVAGMAYAAKHCAKLGWNEINTPEDIRFAVRMGELVTGGESEYKEDPFFLCVKCSVSPLKIGKDSASILYELARTGLPLGVAPMPLAGATSPVTPAAAILTTNAEILGMMVAIWAAVGPSRQEHLPLSAVMDMQTAIASFSNPNAILQDTGASQLWSAFYGIPVHAATDYIDAKFPGYQSGMERAFKIATSLAAGSIYPSVGQLKAGLVCSCEQACLDIEAFDWMHHYLRGVEVTEESLAVELFREEGIGGHFLGSDHTVERFREELFLPTLADRSASGVADMVEAAHAQVEQILADTPLFSRDPEVCREIDRLYLAEVERRDSPA